MQIAFLTAAAVGLFLGQIYLAFFIGERLCRRINKPIGVMAGLIIWALPIGLVGAYGRFIPFVGHVFDLTYGH